MFAPLVLVLLAAVFLFPVLFGDRVLLPADVLSAYPPWKTSDAFEPSNALLSDQVEEFYPDRLLVRDAIRSGALPLWNPWAAAGRPLLANGQSAVFFPLNWLSLLLPLATSFAWIAFAKLVIAGVSMYALVRALDGSRAAATLGGVAFMFSGFIVVWLNHPHTNAAIWLPALFLLALRMVDRPDARRVAALAVVIALQFLGGRPETSLHVLAPTAAWTLFLAFGRTERPRRRAVSIAIVALAAASVLGALIAAVQLVPLAEYVRESATLAARGSWSAIRSPRLLEVPLLVFPYLYGTPVRPRTDFASVVGVRNFNEVSGAYVGVAVVMLAVVAIVALWRREPRVRFFAILAATCWAVALDVPIVATVVNAMPGFALVRNNRLLLVVAFALSCLAAFGLDWVTERASRRALIRLAATALGLAALIGLAVFGGDLALRANRQRLVEQGQQRLEAMYRAQPSSERLASLTQWSSRLPRIVDGIAHSVRMSVVTAGVLAAVAVLLAAFARGALPTSAVAVGFVVVAAADLWLFGASYNPMVEHAAVFPTTPAIEILQKTPGRVLGIDKVLLENTAAVYGIADVRGEDGVNVGRHAELLRWAGARPMHNLMDRSTYPDPDSPIIDLLGVSRVLSTTPVTSDKLRRVSRGEIDVYENTRVVPRAYVVFDWVTDAGDARRILTSPEFRPGRMAVIEHGPPVPSRTDASSAQVRIVADARERVQVRVETTSDGLLVLADTYFPGWRATVDGRPATILRANHAQRAVHVPAGAHDVEFVYAPASVTLGALLTAIGIVTMAVIAARRRRP